MEFRVRRLSNLTTIELQADTPREAAETAASRWGNMRIGERVRVIAEDEPIQTFRLAETGWWQDA